MYRPRPQPSASRRAAWTKLTVVACGTFVGGAMLLAGCAGSSGPSMSSSARTPSVITAAPTVSPTPTPTPTPTGPTLQPEGTAEDNLPLFDAVVQGVWAGAEQVSGRAYVDALVAAGFDKGAMQVTRDETTVGNPAETIMFSVRWGAQCLVGQVGPATGGAIAVVLPGLDDDACLVGLTRQIDW